MTPRTLRPETLTALGVIAVAAALLIPTAELRPISALLPASMLIALIVLSLLLLVRDLRRARAGEPAVQVTQAPKRVLGAFALVVAYALACDFIGFYPATLLVVPVVSALFGYREPKGLALATVIVSGAIWLIFDLGMNQEFPSGRIWSAFVAE